MIICCPAYFIHGLFLYNHYRSFVNHLMRNMAANLSITNKFDDYDSLAELLKRAGISETCIKRLMDEEGFEKPRDLATARDSDIKTTVETVNKLFGAKEDNTQVYFPPIKIVRIRAISIYMNRCLMINQIPDVDLITYDKVLTFVNCLPTWTEKSSDTNDVVKSKSISFDPLKFKTFVDEFKTLLSSIKGCRGITLEYVVRDTNTTTQAPIEVPEPDVNDNNILARFATLVGPDFNQDSLSVFTILRVTLTSTPGWNVISSFSRKKDGRGAFIALKAHYQGRSYFELMKTQATTMMTRTFYSGDRAKFTWEKFVDIHLEAHELFTQTGEPLSESMKILNLKNGIRDTAMMENTIEAARTSPSANATFVNYVNFLTEGISNKRSRAETFKQGNPRTVSSVDTQGGGRGRGYGRGFGRGRGRGRGGRGFGRGRGRSGDHGPAIECEGKTLYIRKAYSQEEYNKLSHAQRDAIRVARLKHKENRKNRDVNEIASTVCKSITESMNKAISDGIRNANQDSTPLEVSSTISETPTQQFSKRRKRDSE